MLSQLALVSVLAASLVSGEAAIKDSPSYAPQRVDCPAGITIRRTSDAVPINPEEAKYVIRKTQNSAADWTSYLNNVGLQGLDVNAFVAGTKSGRPGVDMPNVAFAISGGGQRAMLVGGSMLAAFDNRNTTPAAIASKVGGIQQIATCKLFKEKEYEMRSKSFDRHRWSFWRILDHWIVGTRWIPNSRRSVALKTHNLYSDTNFYF